MQEKISLHAGGPLRTPVRYFKGVGPKRSEDLAKAGIETVEDLLYYLPARYEDRSVVTAVRELVPGEYRTVCGEIVTSLERRTRAGAQVFEAVIADTTGTVAAVWFNQPYLRNRFAKGQRAVFYGKVERYDRLQIVQPEYEILKGDETDSVHIGRIVPVYHATSELSRRYLRALTFQAVTKYARSADEMLPTSLRARQKLVDIRFALQNIHFPATFDSLEKAYRRIVFDEFFMLQLALALKKREAKEAPAGVICRADDECVAGFRRALPFALTAGQEKAIADIERDMASGKPMHRLIEGDVGSGKTVVAAYATALAVGNGYQAVVMAPTEILARQHYISLSELLMPLGINVVLLIGGIDQKARAALCGSIADGTANVVVGTHAVIQGDVVFRRLGLAVVDEQHKFGVEQRALLKGKGACPHLLVMTATPIPRTLALTVYGDLDISVIRELPKGRKPVTTWHLGEAKRADVYAFIREEVARGRQAYIVCPFIDAAAQNAQAKAHNLFVEAQAKGAVEFFGHLHSEVFPDIEMALLHGRMASREKEAVMRDFKKGKARILVATVVIEVGIDIPNATVMLIENAERFGLAQLHQLRGRIGRGEHQAYCILLADPKTDEAAKRLEAVTGTSDGFEIAEQDLSLRGPGEFFGTRQHGLPEIRFGNIVKDFAIMASAREEAFALVGRDSGLQAEVHQPLRAAFRAKFGKKFVLADVA